MHTTGYSPSYGALNTTLLISVELGEYTTDNAIGGTRTLPIFDWDADKGVESCTPFSVAKARLTETKKELAALKIDAKAKSGSEQRGADNVVKWPGCGRLQLEKKLVSRERARSQGCVDHARAGTGQHPGTARGQAAPGAHDAAVAGAGRPRTKPFA